MTELGPTHTDRQLALLRCEVEPESGEEWKYVQDHASDVLPQKRSSGSNQYGVDPQHMEEEWERAGHPMKGTQDD